MAKGAYSPQRGDVSRTSCFLLRKASYSPQRGDVSQIAQSISYQAGYSPHRGDVSFPKIKFIVAPVSSTQ